MSITSRQPPSGHRRANALILVTAVLVLLVIIASAFLVRSQSARAQAAATQRAVGRDDRVESVLRNLSQQLADSLFARRIDASTYQSQIDANDATGLTGAAQGKYFARSDFPTLPPYPFAVRYEVDMFDGSTNSGVSDPGFDNRFLGPYATVAPQERESGKVDGYNFAPFSVIPFTNWPLRYGAIPGESDYRDWFTSSATQADPPAPFPANYSIPTNPRGNPGFGDTRWLASTEPVRAEVSGVAGGSAFPLVRNPASQGPRLTPEGLGFSHWPHLSWIATPNNGFRVCWDISDLEANTIDGAAGSVAGEMALGTPYEQWLPFVAPRELALSSVPQDSIGYVIPDWKDLRWRFAKWFNRQVPAISQGLVRPSDLLPMLGTYAQVPGHQQMVTGVTPANAPNPASRFDAPPNFLQLAAYGDPSDEFKVYTAQDAPPAGSAYQVGDPKPRNLIARTLADADGDGWTDSFWFAAPTSADRGTRQVVAVRVMDNSGLLNANVATRFERTNTIGQTPSDLALISRRESYDLTTAAGRSAAEFDRPVGFFSAPENDPEYRIGNGKAILPIRQLATAPNAQDPYNASSWLLRDAERPNDTSALALPLPVYRAGNAIDVAWAPHNWEGRRRLASSDDLSAAGGVGVAVPGYFGRPSWLAQLGVIREGRSSGRDNSLAPLFNSLGRYGTPPADGYGDFFALVAPEERLNYFKAMQSGGTLADPVTASRLIELTPFGMDDELELRGFNGLNDPQTVSRMESALGWSFAVGDSDARPIDQFLRSTRSREESARFLAPTDPRLADAGVRQALRNGALDLNALGARSGTELLLDHRRKLTTVSGARNDLLPPRLWTIQDYRSGVTPYQRMVTAEFAYDRARTSSGGIPLLPPYHPNRMFPSSASVPPGPDNAWGIAVNDVDGNLRITSEDFVLARQRFLSDNRKLDLRRAMDETAILDDPATAQDEQLIATADGQRQFSLDLQRVMRRALIDDTMRSSGVSADSYFGRPGAGEVERDRALSATKALCASISANLLCFRDAGRDSTILQQINPTNPVVKVDQPLFPSTRHAVAWPSDATPPTAETRQLSAGPDGYPFGFIGIEAHPVIQEVFIALVYPPNRIEQGDLDNAEGRDDPCGTSTVPDVTAEATGVIPNTGGGSSVQGAGEAIAAYDWDNPAAGGAPAVVCVVQIANPFDRPVSLADYEIRINGASGTGQVFRFYVSDRSLERDSTNPDLVKWGNTYGAGVELGPATPEEPRSAIVFAVPETFPDGSPFPRAAWLDFLDIGASVDSNGNGQLDPAEPSTPSVRDGNVAGRWFFPDATALFSPAWGSDLRRTNLAAGGTLLFDVTSPVRDSAGVLTSVPGFDTHIDGRADLLRWTPPVGDDSPYVTLVRRVQNPDTPAGFANVIVDRFDNVLDQELREAGKDLSFVGRARATIPNPSQPALSERSRVPAKRLEWRCNQSIWSLNVDGVRIGAINGTLRPSLVTWVRGARQWLWDVDGDGLISSDERTPRFAFARTTGVSGSVPANLADPGGTENSADLNPNTLVGGAAPPAGGPYADILAGDRVPDRVASLTPTAADGAAWITREYYNVMGQQRRGKPTFFSSRCFEVGNSRIYPRFGPDPASGTLPSQDSVEWTSFLPSGAPAGSTVRYGEKGVTESTFVDQDRADDFVAPLRLKQKDRDLDQIAEIFDLPMWGPLVEFTGNANRRTFITYPEILALPGALSEELDDVNLPMFAASVLDESGMPLKAPRSGSWQQQVRWNRLSIEPPVYLTPQINDPNLGSRPRQLWGNQVLPTAYQEPGVVPVPQQNGIGFNARLPGAVALLDAFVLDDRGAAPLDANDDGSVSPNEWADAENRRLRLAGGFSGSATTGLVNVNTAPVEVLRALPHLTRFGYFDDYPIRVTSESAPAGLTNPSSALSQAMLISDPLHREISPAMRSILGLALDGGASPFPTVRVASAIDLYRNKMNTLNAVGNAWTYPALPTYVDRGAQLAESANFREFCPGMRVERGFDSLGELGLLVRGAAGPRLAGDADADGTVDQRQVAAGAKVDLNYNGIVDPTSPFDPNFAGIPGPDSFTSTSWGNAMSWSIRYAGSDPFRSTWDRDGGGLGANSTAIRGVAPAGYVQGVPIGSGAAFSIGGRTAIDDHVLIVAQDNPSTAAAADPVRRFDRTSGDALEQNSLLRGISNIVTTRSDVFTMWVRVRTIRQDPLTGLWNATDPDSIVDDSRYVLTIDRSAVDRPGDAPKILSAVQVPK